MVSSDVKSFYPSQIVKLRYEHKHDPYFIEKYEEAYQDKIDGKREGNVLKESLAKLVLNSSFGKLMSLYSALYNLKSGYKITINGQLMLAMLIEMLMLKGFKVVDANTDAVSVIVEKERYEEYLAICKNWEDLTKMELDHENFKKVYQLSCNHYIAVKADKDGNTYCDENGKPKTKLKGWFESESDLLKGYEYPVVKKALYEYFVNGIYFKTFIENHNDIYDFCMSTRMGKDNETGKLYNAYHGPEILQRTNRYYAGKGKDAAYILKSSDGVNFQHVLKDSKVIIMNDFVDKQMKDYNINYDFYIEQARKIADKIIPQQLSLF